MREPNIRDFAWSHQRATASNDGRAPRGLPEEGASDDLPQAVAISGAGTTGADGIYRRRPEKLKSNAPVYKHATAESNFSISREPHTSQKTGKTKHGWLLYDQSSPLYGVQSEALAVPSSGWRAFQGDAPVPKVETFRSAADAFVAEADVCGRRGEEAAEQEQWAAASSSFSAALQALGLSGQRFGGAFELRAAWLLSRRAEASLQLEAERAALRDAVAALELVPTHDRARTAAVKAAEVVGQCSAEAALDIVEVAGSGQILDRGAPLHLSVVDQWVEEVAHVARLRASTKRVVPAASTPDVPAPEKASQPSPPVKKVDFHYHRGFMHWINFLRSNPLDDEMFREDWAEMVGQKMSSLSWKYTARRVGVNTTDLSCTEAVLQLMLAYEAAGKPPGPPLPEPARCEAEHLMATLGRQVRPVRDERPNLENIDPTAESTPPTLRIPMAGSLKPLN